MLTNFDLLEYHPFASIVLDLDGKIVFNNKKTKLLLQEITSKEDSKEISSFFPLFTLLNWLFSNVSFVNSLCKKSI